MSPKTSLFTTYVHRTVSKKFVLLAAFLLLVLPAFAQGPARTRHLRELVRNGQVQAIDRLPATQELNLSILLPLHNEAGLDSLLREIYDPASPMYHHYLTVQEFTDRFGPTVQEYSAAVAYVKAHGMTVTGDSPNRLVVPIKGTVANIEEMLHVNLLVYPDPIKNRTFFSADREPTPEFAVWHIAGLDNYSMPHPMLRFAQNDGVQRFQTGSGPGGQFLGSDMRAAYYGGSALTGAGQSIGLFGLNFNISDVQAYFNAVNQPFNSSVVQTISINGYNTACGSGCDDGEPVIDIIESLSMAPGVNAVIEYEASNDVDTFNRMATDNVAKQLSASVGWEPADPTQDEPIFKEFAAQGQNLFASSDDSGAYSSSNQSFYPADDPYITSVGGTDIVTNGAGGSWQSESAWVGSGGGVSTNNMPIPSYQQLPGVINSSNGGSTTLRNSPDVAAEANTDNYFCANGSCGGGVGGTSLSAPRWAGFLALVNQQAAQNGNPPVGFLNPLVYAIGTGSNYNNDFHDITTGNNANSSASFNAVTGYDLVTGWGSPNGQNLINALAGSPANFSLSASPSSVSVAQGASGSTTITVTPQGGFSGSVSLSASGLPSGVTASFSPASTTGTSTLTFSASSTAATGTSTVTVTGTSGSLTHTTTVSLTVSAAPNFALSASPSSVTITQGSSGTSTVTITPQNGFSSSVSLSASGLPSGVTASFSPASTTSSSTLTLTASSTAATGTATVTVTGTSGSLSHSATLSLTVNGQLGVGQVNLSSVYNVSGIVTDGTSFSGGLDNDGYAYSSNLLGSSQSFNGATLAFGPANAPDAVSSTTVPLPSGKFSVLNMLATAVNGNQTSQSFTVNYSDGTSQTFTQSLSDWFTPQSYSGESNAVTMAYRDTSSGGRDSRTFYLYGYVFALDGAKTVSSIVLPNNRNVVVLAITLAPSAAAKVSLSSAYNRTGIVNDGTTFSGGVDGDGYATSANLLGSSQTFNGTSFGLGAANASDVVSTAGQTITLPGGFYSSLQMLALGVNGNQASQTFTVTYTDGTTSTFTQSVSDWFTPQSYSGESKAATMAYRDTSTGGKDSRTFYLYGYSFALNNGKAVSSVKLPSDANVEVFALTLVP